MRVQVTEMEECSSSISSSTTVPLPILQSPKRIARVASWNVFQRRPTAQGGLSGSIEHDLAASQLERARRNLREAVLGGDDLDLWKGRAWTWYLSYLDGKLVPPIWDDLAVPVIAAISEGMDCNGVQARIAIYAVLTEVARTLLGDGEITIPDIVNRLRDPPPPAGDKFTEAKVAPFLQDGHDDLATQLVFQMIGWLTSLWEPLPDVSCSELRLVGARQSRRRTGILYDPIIRNFTLPIKELAYQPLHRTAARFGKLFPIPELCLEDNTLGSRDIESACITAGYVSYHSLKDIVDVSIAWTGTLGQHLEYDQRQRKLYVFKYPSICLLLYRNTTSTLLSDVFKQQQQEQAETKQCSGVEQLEFVDYLREVLLSYRLVFAQSPRSIRLITKEIEKETSLSADCDILLRALCTSPERSDDIEAIYHMLDAGPCENYVMIGDFPFLAKRFIHLQKASMGRNPHSLRRLWRDRRNPPAWFALWAVLMITGATLLLQFLQLCFQIYSPVQ